MVTAMKQPLMVNPGRSKITIPKTVFSVLRAIKILGLDLKIADSSSTLTSSAHPYPAFKRPLIDESISRAKEDCTFHLVNYFVCERTGPHSCYVGEKIFHFKCTGITAQKYTCVKFVASP